MATSAAADDGLELHRPGSDPYRRATSPHNSSGEQHPVAVVIPLDEHQVASAVRLAGERGWMVAPQATGHGAAGDIGEDTLLLDTSRLDSIAVERTTRLATVGAGATWAGINRAGEPHGLLGRAGTSSTVGAAGYSFGGGVGWLVRPHGLSAAHLGAVSFVDGTGRLRRAASDASDEGDREAWWAFRGGGGVGVATSLELELVAVADLHAGFLLWPAEHLEAVVEAWARALPAVGASLVSCVSLLHAPPGPPFPPDLRGQPVVHLSVAASAGSGGAEPLFDALASIEAPTINTWGPADAERLAGIHLDPPSRVPAFGDGRWLTDKAPAHTTDLLGHGLVDGSPLMMIEIRHVGNADPEADGAMTTVPGPFLLHAVGSAADTAEREEVHAALDRLRAAAAPVDTGLAAPAFAEGQRTTGASLSAAGVERLGAIRARVDPAGLIRTARRPGGHRAD